MKDNYSVEVKQELFKYCTYGVYVVSSGVFGCLIDTFMQITSAKEEHTKALMVISKNSDTANAIKRDRQCLIQIPSTKSDMKTLKTLGYTHSTSTITFTEDNSYTMYNNSLNRYEYVIRNVCGVLSAQVDKVYNIKDKYLFILDIDNFDNARTVQTLKPLTYTDFNKRIKRENRFNKFNIFKKRSK